MPCNRVVYLRTEELQLPEQEIKDPGGATLTAARIEELLRGLPHESDGSIRALASQFLKGKPLGPWDYSGVWEGDLNDVIPHEDRRELRGSRILGAWINHHDARSQNTLAVWIDDGEGRGHVEHHILDWGDTLGGLTQWDSLSRRVGYTYYIDFGAIGADFFTFGAVSRPWERAKFGPSGKIFGYFNDTDFVPEDWHVGYPNPAFSAMQESDGAWMARIISHLDDADIEAIVNGPAVEPHRPERAEPHPPRSPGPDSQPLPPAAVVARAADCGEWPERGLRGGSCGARRTGSRSCAIGPALVLLENRRRVASGTARSGGVLRRHSGPRRRAARAGRVDGTPRTGPAADVSLGGDPPRVVGLERPEGTNPPSG